MKQKSTLHLTVGHFFLIFIFIQGALSMKQSKNPPWNFGSTSLPLDEGLPNSAMDYDELSDDMNLSGSSDDSAVEETFITGPERPMKLFGEKRSQDS